MKKAFLAFSRAGMEAYFKALTDKPFVLDKSRGWGVHFDLLSMIFGEEPKIICMVRDLRQIQADQSVWPWLSEVFTGRSGYLSEIWLCPRPARA